MNICILTTQIIANPKLSRCQRTTICQLILCRKNKRKNQLPYKLKAIAKNRIAKKIFNTAEENRFIIIKGFIYIRKVKFVSSDNKWKIKKNIAVKIKKIYYI